MSKRAAQIYRRSLLVTARRRLAVLGVVGADLDDDLALCAARVEPLKRAPDAVLVEPEHAVDRDLEGAFVEQLEDGRKVGLGRRQVDAVVAPAEAEPAEPLAQRLDRVDAVRPRSAGRDGEEEASDSRW